MSGLTTSGASSCNTTMEYTTIIVDYTLILTDDLVGSHTADAVSWAVSSGYTLMR